MAHRGSQAAAEDRWVRGERRDGYADGKKGVEPQAANEWYLRGHRDGRLRRLIEQGAPRCGAAIRNPDLVGRDYCLSVASREVVIPGRTETLPVCGIHSRVYQRAGHVTRALVRRLR